MSAPPASLGTTEPIEAHYCHIVLVSVWSGLKNNNNVHLSCIHQRPERLQGPSTVRCPIRPNPQSRVVVPN